MEAIIEKIKTIVNNVNPNIDPEYFSSSVHNTFEDRYIVFLIDQIASLLAVTSSNLAASTKRLSDYYIAHHIPFNDVARLKEVDILSSSSKTFIKEERKLLQAREALGNLMETNYYNCLKNEVAFNEECVCINGVIANDPLYGECYDFYKRLEEIKSIHQDIPEPIRDLDYHNYVLLNLLLTLDNSGFSLSGNSPEFDNKDYLIRVKNLKLTRNNFLINIATENDDHIDLIIENNDESNGFVITSIKGAQDNNVIISSPLVNPFDANLKNMIENILLVLPANQFTYSHFCPVCGGHVDNVNNNYRCSVCDSVYMLYTRKDQKEIVWVKRLKNLEGK